MTLNFSMKVQSTPEKFDEEFHLLYANANIMSEKGGEKSFCQHCKVGHQISRNALDSDAQVLLETCNIFPEIFIQIFIPEPD